MPGLEDQDERQEAADDQAVGHALRATVGSYFKGRQGVAIVVLALALTGREGWHWLYAATPDATTTAAAAKDMAKIERTLNEVSNNVLEVKIKVNAMLDVMPKDQQMRAKALIQDRMEVLADARKQADRRLDQ